MLAGKDARTLVRDVLAMMQKEFSTAFKTSAMERAKLRGLKRNVALVSGNAGTADDADVLTPASKTTSRSCASMRHGHSPDW